MTDTLFTEIEKFIVSKLQLSSIDELYMKKHPMFKYENNTVSLKKYELYVEIANKFKIDHVVEIKSYIRELDTHCRGIDRQLNDSNQTMKFTSFLRIIKEWSPLYIFKDAKNIFENQKEESRNVKDIYNIEKLSARDLILKICFRNFKYWVSEPANTLFQEFKNDMDEYKKSFKSTNVNSTIILHNVNKTQEHFDYEINDIYSNKNYILWLKNKNKSNLKDLEKQINKVQQNIEVLQKKQHQIHKEYEIINSHLEGIKIELKIADKTINENNAEIKTIKRWQDKEPYKSRIKALINENNQLVNKINKKKEKQLKEKESLSIKSNKTQNLIKEKLQELKKLKNQKEELLIILTSASKNQTEIEKKAKHDVTELLFKNNLTQTNIFLKAFNNYFEKINFGIIKELLLSFLGSSIQQSKRLIIMEGTENNPKLAVVSQTTNVNDCDYIAPLYFSIKAAIKKNEFIETHNGIIYLNMGNGVFIKLFARNSNAGLNSSQILLMERNQAISTTRHIFSGYTRTGYLLPKGLYLYLKGYVIELYFHADSTLLGVISNYMYHQNLEDFIKIEEEKKEEERKEEEKKRDDYYS